MVTRLRSTGDYAVWHAFGNHYWPALYFADTQGGIRHHQTTVRFHVLLDGRSPGAAHGADLDGVGDGTVVEQRLYQLIRQHGAVTDHIFEITFLDPGVEAYAFTFG